MLYLVALTPAVAFVVALGGMAAGAALHVSRRAPEPVCGAVPVMPIVITGTASAHLWPVDADPWPLLTFPEFLAHTGQPYPAADAWRISR